MMRTTLAPKLGEKYQQHAVLTRVILPGSLGVPWPLADQPCQSPPYRYPLPRCSAPPSQMAWDHVASALDSRESAFELYASGGVPAWRGRLRRRFERYNALANAVLRTLNIDMPDIDLSSLREVPWAPRRTVTPPAPPL